jgi:broad specificity phosphatase PhoE
VLTTIYIARHGETESNAERRFQGQQDSPLSARGRQQAVELAERLAGLPLAAVYSSDLGRALRTAEAVADRHGLAVRSHPGLREINVGRWTGRLYADLERADPEAIARWRTRPLEHRFPDGESIADVRARALRALDEIAARHRGAAVAVITHGTLLASVLAHAAGLPLAALWRRVPNCALSVLAWEDGRLRVLECYDPALLSGRRPPRPEAGQDVA